MSDEDGRQMTGARERPAFSYFY